MYIVEMMIRSKGELVNPCGSDYGAFIRDLKTIKGVRNRIKNWSIPKDVEEIRVYSCGSSPFTNQAGPLVDRIKIGKEDRI